MSEEKRFDKWSPLVPKVGQVMQLQFSEITIEAEVKTRFTRDGETFTIEVSTAYGSVLLTITPTASAVGMTDRALGLKPYWQVSRDCAVPGHFGAFRKLYFLD